MALISDRVSKQIDVGPNNTCHIQQDTATEAAYVCACIYIIILLYIYDTADEVSALALLIID